MKSNIIIFIIFYMTQATFAQKNKPCIRQSALSPFLFPHSLIRPPLPSSVCAELLGKSGYYNNIFDMFTAGKNPTSKQALFRLYEENGEQKIHMEYINCKEYFDISVKIDYFDGYYAILVIETSGVVVIDMQHRLILAFTPARVLNMKFPEFYNLYFLDKQLFPYASLDTGQAALGDSDIKVLHLSRYNYQHEYLEREYLDYKFDKNLYEINYADICRYHKILLNKNLKIIKTKKLGVGNEVGLFKNIPSWF